MGIITALAGGECESGAILANISRKCLSSRQASNRSQETRASGDRASASALSPKQHSEEEGM